jgi:hypothetical protein
MLSYAYRDPFNPLELVEELAVLERATWAEVSAAIPAWHPRLEGDDDDDAGKGDDDDDAAKGKGKSDDDDDAGKGDDDEKGKGKSLEDRLEAAERAAQAANKELRRRKSEEDERDRKSKEEAGKFKDLYEETKRELDELKGEVSKGKVRNLGVEALRGLSCKDPERYVRLLDLDDVDDKTSAERAARKLKREDASLFGTGRAVTLAQAASSPRTTYRPASSSDSSSSRPILDRLPLIGSRATPTPTTPSSLPGIEFRAVNAAYTESTGAVVQASEGSSSSAATPTSTRSSRRPAPTSTTRSRRRSTSRSRPPRTSSKTRSSTATSPSTPTASTASRSASPAPRSSPPARTASRSSATAAPTSRRAWTSSTPSSPPRRSAATTAPSTPTTSSWRVSRRPARRANLVSRPTFSRSAPSPSASPLPRHPDPRPRQQARRRAHPAADRDAGHRDRAPSSVYAVRFGDDEADQAVTGLVQRQPRPPAPSARGCSPSSDSASSRPSRRTASASRASSASALFGGQAAARGTGFLNA